MTPILIVLLILLILGGIPPVGLHSYGWGPSGLLTVLLIVLLVMVILGKGR